MNKFKILIISGLILNIGSTFSMEEVSKEQELFLAIFMGNVKKIKELILMGVNVNAKNENGATPLLMTATGNLEIVKALIKAGADVNAKYDQDDGDLFAHGITPLARAASSGRLETVETLIKAGANVNSEDQGIGGSPLFKAVGAGHLKIAKVLIDAGAKKNVKSGGGSNIIMIRLSNKGNLGPAKLLAAAGIDIEVIKNKHPKLYDTLKNIKTSWPILVDAIQKGYPGRVKKIAPLMGPALILSVDNNGNTLLHKAIELHKAAKTKKDKQNYLEIIGALILGYPGLVDIKNNAGQTPIKFAVGIGNIDVLKGLTKI